MPLRLVRVHAKLWIIFALLWVAGVAADTCQRARYEARYREWSSAQQVVYEQAAKAMKPVDDLAAPAHLRSLQARCSWWLNDTLWNRLIYPIGEAIAERARSIPRRKVEELLNNGVPFITQEVASVSKGPSRPAEIYEDALYTVPGHDLTLRIRFENGYFSGYRVNDPRPQRPQLELWWHSLPCEAEAVSKYLRYAWLCLLPMVPFLGRHRFLGAELLLMLALSSLLTQLPCPIDSEAWTRVFRNEGLAWEVSMIACTLSLITWIRFSDAARSRIRCLICDYNLTGNASGICPECGSSIPHDIRDRLHCVRLVSPPNPTHCDSARTGELR